MSNISTHNTPLPLVLSPGLSAALRHFRRVDTAPSTLGEVSQAASTVATELLLCESSRARHSAA